MLRQLARLTRPLPAAGPRALALVVYSDHTDGKLAAAEKGFEGVACVDDSARAVVLLSDLYLRTRIEELRAWAEGLFDGVAYMQSADGDFANFVEDWDGTRNLSGETSLIGGAFWHARALRAAVHLATTLSDPRARRVAELAFKRLPARCGADIRAIHVMAGMEAGRHVESWCDEIASCRAGDVLLDHEGQARPHLWAHVQEGVLARAGAVLGRPDLVRRAVRSAREWLIPIVESGFALPSVEPYGVACAAFSLDALGDVTGDAVYAKLAAQAREWFDGRNPSGQPIYDRATGHVHDGVDAGIVNRHSGAESNIVAAQALFEEVAARLLRDTSGCFPLALSSRSSVGSSAAS